MMNIVGLTSHYKTVHPLSVILITKKDTPVVLPRMDIAIIIYIIVHVLVALITVRREF